MTPLPGRCYARGMRERIDQCEGFDVLAARMKGSRWAIYRGTASLGACDACGAPVGIGEYRSEYDYGFGDTYRYCTHHPIVVVVSRVRGIDIEGVPRPPAGSPGEARLRALAADLGLGWPVPEATW